MQLIREVTNEEVARMLYTASRDLAPQFGLQHCQTPFDELTATERTFTTAVVATVLFQLRGY